ncbi:MAG: porphobilinogen synthase, partial [Chloroflexota bacterium]|nr:porphobilinogen synthase [Chloroflexota bacterium]
MPSFQRTRRLRNSPAIRDFVRETSLRASDFVYPLFIVEGEGFRREISSMPGQYQLSVDQLEREVAELGNLGIPGVLLFGIPDVKDDQASGAFAPDGIVQRAVREIKRVNSDLLVITDVCACEYTDHGHCGILVGDTVDNDLTLPLLARTAVSHAAAGADIVAPSDMMDGRVAVIRGALDASGQQLTPVMSYAAKYFSAFYGPFRDAAGSTPAFGDRRSHQMDPANVHEAMREVALDVDEGADIVMVKPAVPYLDIIRRVKDAFGYPTAAYHVSGEYA